LACKTYAFQHDERAVIAMNTQELLGEIESRLTVEKTSDGTVLVDPVSNKRRTIPPIQCDEPVIEGYKMLLAERVLAGVE